MGRRLLAAWLLVVSSAAAPSSRVLQAPPGPRPVSLPQLATEATGVEQLLAIGEIAKLPGEETLHWESQLVHQEKRQRGCNAALRRLSRMLVGSSKSVVEERARVASTRNFERLVVGACSVRNDQADESVDVEAATELLTSLSLLLLSLPVVVVESTKPAVSSLVGRLEKHLSSSNNPPLGDAQLDHLHAAVGRLGLISNERTPNLASLYASRRLPFALMPRFVNVSLDEIREQVNFQQSVLVTKESIAVKERRQTAWLADPGVGGLAYSGKVMRPTPFPSCVDEIRQHIYQHTGCYYDCVLVNMYSDGECACAWHVDPDLGTIFSRETLIVSVGETRRFTLRKISMPQAAHHVHHVHDGDAFFMCGSCQEEYQHAVLKAENDNNNSPRVSLVFKKTLPGPGGKRGHGIPSSASPAAQSKPVQTRGKRGPSHAGQPKKRKT